MSVHHRHDPRKVINIWSEPVTPPWKNSDGRTPNPLYCGSLKDGTKVYRYHSSGVRAVVDRLGLTSYALPNSGGEAWLTAGDFLKVRDHGIKSSLERHKRKLAPAAVAGSDEDCDRRSALLNKKLKEITDMEGQIARKEVQLAMELASLKGQRERLAEGAAKTRDRLALIEEYRVLRSRERELLGKILT